MTEDEAKTKWCPFVRYASNKFTVAGSSFNRMGSNENVNCFGSGCMMWREHEPPEIKIATYEQFMKNDARLATSNGYCGLAGKPAP